MSDSPRGTRSTVALAAVVQFVVLLDFALILPLGPDLAEPLAIPAASLGLLVVVHTAAAALAGLLAARVLDRFARRQAMLPLLIGLALANVGAALAPSFAALLCMRTLAGLCAGPISALIQSLIADEVPSEKRGRALGVVMSANAVAAVLGVPTCLWLADRVAWGLAFVLVAAAALLAALALAASSRATQRARPDEAAIGPSSAAQRALQRRAHAMTFVAFASAFALTPNLSAYVQFNLAYPRSDIPLLYMIAGCASFVAMRMSGRAVDRLGSAWVGSLAIVGLAMTTASFLVAPTPWLAIEPAFIALLVCLGARNVALRTLVTRIPAARGRFMALQSTAQQLGSVAGVLLGMALLRDRPDGGLAGMPALACCSIALLVAVPPLLWWIESCLRTRNEGAGSTHGHPDHPHGRR